MKKTSENIFAVSVSIATALFLAVGKTLVFFASGSIAILASALDSALDAVVSMVNFFAIRAAEKPADREHGFGHGKFEAFAEFGQGIFLWCPFLPVMQGYCMSIWSSVFPIKRHATLYSMVKTRAPGIYYSHKSG